MNCLDLSPTLPRASVSPWLDEGLGHSVESQAPTCSLAPAVDPCDCHCGCHPAAGPLHGGRAGRSSGSLSRGLACGIPPPIPSPILVYPLSCLWASPKRTMFRFFFFT